MTAVSVATLVRNMNPFENRDLFSEIAKHLYSPEDIGSMMRVNRMSCKALKCRAIFSRVMEDLRFSFSKDDEELEIIYRCRAISIVTKWVRRIDNRLIDATQDVYSIDLPAFDKNRRITK
jgi:hypothetical protein